MTNDTIIMSVIPHENGVACVWAEPVVVRGDLSPPETKPPEFKKPDEPAAFESESEAQARVAHEKFTTPFTGVLDAMHRATKAAEDRIVYRMVRRAMVFKDGEDISPAIRAVKGSQRVQDDLNRRGAFAEGEIGGGLPNMPLLMAGMAAGGDVPPRKRKTSKKAPKPRRPKK